MQALYQWQMTKQPAAEIQGQYLEGEEAAGADREYFDELVGRCIAESAVLSAALTPYADRPIEQLDPIETAILMIGIYELKERLDVPYRVVINEAVDLCKRYGATDAHKYVNAVLDRAAREVRAAERS